MLDLESEGLSSIPTMGIILSPEFFLFSHSKDENANIGISVHMSNFYLETVTVWYAQSITASLDFQVFTCTAQLKERFTLQLLSPVYFYTISPSYILPLSSHSCFLKEDRLIFSLLCLYACLFVCLCPWFRPGGSWCDFLLDWFHSLLSCFLVIQEFFFSIINTRWLMVGFFKIRLYHCLLSCL